MKINKYKVVSILNTHVAEYKSLRSYVLEGKGRVFVVKNEKERIRSENNLVGSFVLIDNIPYKIRGVESFAKTIIPEGDLIGLLVY